VCDGPIDDRRYPWSVVVGILLEEQLAPGVEIANGEAEAIFYRVVPGNGQQVSCPEKEGVDIRQPLPALLRDGPPGSIRGSSQESSSDAIAA
jgi:hypothetical protein